jgi:hypothetical protein
VLADSQEPADADDRVGHPTLGCDDEILDNADFLLSSLYTGLPRIFFLALQPCITAFNSSSLTPIVSEPAGRPAAMEITAANPIVATLVKSRFRNLVIPLRGSVWFAVNMVDRCQPPFFER